MNVITYRLLKVVKDLSGNIDEIVKRNIYRNDVGNHIKNEIRNELIAIHEYTENYLHDKTTSSVYHNELAYSRLRLAKILDEIIDMEFFGDRELLMTNNVYDSLIILRQTIYIVMSQIAMNEF